MFCTSKHRNTAAVVAATLALGAAAPASAQPFQLNSNGSFVPAGAHIQQQGPGPARRSSHQASGSGVDLGFVALGSGVASVVLIGVGGTLTLSRRQRRAGIRRSTLAA
jgi:hypothetical protein